ncbi:MAG: urease accessory UreF family protein [Pseudomonadota bacterium]
MCTILNKDEAPPAVEQGMPDLGVAPEGEALGAADRGTSPADHAALLSAWLSPNFPIGGYAYSGGLERAVEAGLVTNEAELAAWLSALIDHGALRNDTILLANAAGASPGAAFDDIAALGAALQPTAERYQEATAQGEAFTQIYISTWRAQAPGPCPLAPYANNAAPITLPCAFAGAVNAFAIAPRDAALAYAVATLNNQISAAIRLSIIGQIGGQRLLAGAFPTMRAAICQLADAPLSALGSAAMMADICSMQHETQTVRLFQS